MAVLRLYTETVADIPIIVDDRGGREVFLGSNLWKRDVKVDESERQRLNKEN